VGRVIPMEDVTKENKRDTAFKVIFFKRILNMVCARINFIYI
jgi:hypothetical protein